MKLTDEQRNGWHSYLQRAKENGWENAPLSVSQFESILSSEQAWKEDANRWEQREWTQANEVAKLQHQLNQAIEVLKEIRKITPYGMYHEMIDPVLPSLQEDKT